jgi:heme exporter protein D
MEALLTGPYAAYIGPAYAVTAVTFLVLVVSSLAHARRWKRRAGGDRK